VADTVDPLGGSYYVESLTDALEAKIRAYLDEVAELGGAAVAIPYFQEQIHQSAYEHQQAVESGDRVIVGVNEFREDEAGARIEQPDYGTLEAEQVARLEAVRADRDDGEVARRLDAVAAAAEGDDNLLPSIVDAVKAMATLGEISDVLRRAWGEHRGA
jgi:methylmalonyl-CoA mutase N-terminal domain/subunit